MIPLPEIKVTDKTLPVLESLGVCLNQMIEIQMSAYPECWSVEDRREMACQHLANTAAPYRAFVPSASNPASRVSPLRASIDFRKGE